MTQTPSLASEDYFVDVLCGYTDQAYQFALGLSCHFDTAKELVFQVYEGFSRDLPVPRETGEEVHEILKQLWLRACDSDLPSFDNSSQDSHGEQNLAKEESKGDHNKDQDVAQQAKVPQISKETMKDQSQTKSSELPYALSLLRQLTLVERGVIVLSDYFGLSKAVIQHILVIDEREYLSYLAKAREWQIDYLSQREDQQQDDPVQDDEYE